MIHHSALSFKRLRSMKILDRKSVSMTVLSSDIDASDLSKTEFFGQFGAVKSLRVLQNSEPKEIYLRFDNESSAKQAIAWCVGQPSVFKNAQHGFNKYCITFINHKQCAKEGCENRHSWADTQDILTFAETRVPGVNVSPHGQNQNPSHAQANAPCPLALTPLAPQQGSVSSAEAPASPVTPPVATSTVPSFSATAATPASVKQETQQRAVQVALQSRLIDDLMRELADLQKVNYALKVHVDKLKRTQVQAAAMSTAMSMAPMVPMMQNRAQLGVDPMALGMDVGNLSLHMNSMAMNMKVNVPLNVPMRPSHGGAAAYGNGF